MRIKALMMIQKLKEKMMTSNEATTQIIIKAKEEMGSPKMTAPFLMFL
ncbi:hypothetical protein HC174_12120 [Salinimicrobium sp. CDJ15-81-2]|uniref:Uncharacterized protein n=1 Tax=Autumnicola lenta TaxID=3075593 RepID=A0ABU3CL71_9FLAO|nr:hypothetical protein [Zunongwangia sp. F260]MDT0647104.1 hypothetical protein [Zunongwangia sp. F260]NJY63492.1 hypothetical protein [Salinimicrobium nanhaiense]